jgi:hypothetical protein
MVCVSLMTEGLVKGMEGKRYDVLKRCSRQISLKKTVNNRNIVSHVLYPYHEAGLSLRLNYRLTNLDYIAPDTLDVFLWRIPQQMLRMHRSLKALCATLWLKDLYFFIFPCNGAKVEWNWQGKTEVLGRKYLSQCHFVHHKSNMDWCGIEPGPPWWEAGD